MWSSCSWSFKSHWGCMFLVPWGWILAHLGLSKISIGSQYCDCLSPTGTREWARLFFQATLAQMPGLFRNSFLQAFLLCLFSTQVSLPTDGQQVHCCHCWNGCSTLAFVCLHLQICYKGNTATRHMRKPLGGSPQVGIFLSLWRVYCLAQVLCTSVPVPVSSDNLHTLYWDTLHLNSQTTYLGYIGVPLIYYLHIYCVLPLKLMCKELFFQISFVHGSTIN